MLFKFLGNSDAPDWLLSEMNTLSLVSSVRIKFILTQIYNILVGATIDYDLIYKHLLDAKLSESQKRSLLTLLAFIIQSTVRFDVEPEDLAQELLQLGAPQAHASTITRYYRSIRRNLRAFYKSNFFRFNEPIIIESQADIVMKKKNASDFPKSRVTLRVNQKETNKFVISMTSTQADDLARELKTAIDVMRSFK